MSKLTDRIAELEKAVALKNAAQLTLANAQAAASAAAAKCDDADRAVSALRQGISEGVNDLIAGIDVPKGRQSS